MNVTQWKTEIREFLAEVRSEIHGVLESLPTQEVVSTAGNTTTPFDDQRANSEVSDDRTLDRLERLKRQLNERLQNRGRQNAVAGGETER